MPYESKNLIITQVEVYRNKPLCFWHIPLISSWSFMHCLLLLVLYWSFLSSSFEVLGLKLEDKLVLHFLVTKATIIPPFHLRIIDAWNSLACLYDFKFEEVLFFIIFSRTGYEAELVFYISYHFRFSMPTPTIRVIFLSFFLIFSFSFFFWEEHLWLCFDAFKEDVHAQ